MAMSYFDYPEDTGNRSSILSLQWSESLSFSRALDSVLHNFIIGISKLETREDVINRVIEMINFAKDIASLERKDLSTEMDELSESSWVKLNRIANEYKEIFGDDSERRSA